MTTIYLVRHAHSIYTPDELTRPLSKKGFEDTRKLKKRLSDLHLDVIVSSPYQRAVETVQPFNSTRQPIVMIDGFKERQVAANPIADFNNGLYRLWHEPNFSFEGGESNTDAQIRGIEALHELLMSYEGKDVMCGTHGNIMTLIMQHYDEAFGYDFWCRLKMPAIYKMTFEGLKFINITEIYNEEVS